MVLDDFLSGLEEHFSWKIVLFIIAIGHLIHLNPIKQDFTFLFSDTFNLNGNEPK